MHLEPRPGTAGPSPHLRELKDAVRALLGLDKGSGAGLTTSRSYWSKPRGRVHYQQTKNLFATSLPLGAWHKAIQRSLASHRSDQRHHSEQRPTVRIRPGFDPRALPAETSSI